MNKKTWKLDHYYYGKHVEGDKAIGGFTVLKRSPGIDDARLSYCEANCHFGGTERVGSDFEQLGLAYGFFPYPEKSGYIVAHARPSRYKNRGHHYLEYHFVFLPEAALEAVSFDPTVFFEAASFEETPSDKPLSVTLDASKGLSSAKIATMFDDILTSFPDASLLPGLLNTMLAGRRVSFQHTPIDGGWRVRFMTGLLQYLPVPVRPSISFVTEVFTDSCTAQVLFEYNHRYASSAGDVRVDWETQTISGTDGLPSYDYTQHLLQKKAHRLPDKANTYLQQPAWKEDLKPLLSGQTNHTAGEILDVALFLHHLKTQQAQNTVNLSTLIRVVQMTDNLLPDERYADLISTLLEEAIKKKQPQKAMESIPAHAIQTSQERLQNTLRMLCSTGHGETCFQVAHHLDKQIAANRFASATAIAWIEHLLASAQESSALRALTTIEKVIRDAAIWKTILQSLQSTISNRPPAFARELLILAAHYQLDDILLSLLKQPVPATYWSPEIQPYQRLVNGKNPAAPETVYPAAQRFRQPEKALALLFRLAARQQPAALTARDWQQLRSQPEAIRQVLDLYSPEEWASTYTGNLNTLFEVYQRAVQIQRHDTGKQIIVHATRHLEKQVLITYLQNNLQYLTADIADMIFDELADDEARVQLAGLVLANNNWQDATYLTKYAKLAVTLSYHQSDYDRQLIEHLHRLDDALQKQTVMRLVDAHPADTDMIGGVLKKLLVMRTPDDALLTEVIEHLRRIKHLQTALISLDAIFRLNSDTQTILYFFTGRSPVRPADWVSFYEEKLHVLFERLYLLLTQQKFPAADALTDEMLRQLPNTSVLHVFKEEMSKFTHETSLRLAGQIEPKITEPPLQYEILVILLNLGGWNESRYLQSLARLSADSKMSRKQHEMQLIEQLTLLGDQAIPTLKRYTKHYIVNSGNLNQTALGPLETALQKASLQQQITWLQTFFDCFSTNKSSVLQAVSCLSIPTT